MTPSEYCEISIEIFLNMTGRIPFDVYVQIGADKFTKVSRRNDPVDKARIDSYLKKGATHLFILRKERRDYITATEGFIQGILRESPISSQSASRALEELTEQALFEIYEDKLFDEESLNRAQTVTKMYVGILKSDPKVLTQFIQLCRNETYQVRHSIATSVLSILVARTSGIEDDKMLQIIGLGGLLHDVGMSALPAKLTDVDRKLNADEWAQVKRHPQMGVDLTKGVKDFPEQLSLILLQHHENYDGSGYPQGLKGENIFLPARIVAIADCFSALTTRRGGRALFSPREAMSLLQKEIHKFDPGLLTTFEGLVDPAKLKKTA